MRSLLFATFAALVAMAGVADAQVKSGAVTPSMSQTVLGPGRLALGGVAERLVWRDQDGFSAGFMPVQGALSMRSQSDGKPVPMAGFFAWNSGSYRIDANLRPVGFSGFSAGIGAQTGVPFGEEGTTYGVRINAGLSGERFSISPANRFGVIDPDTAASDLNLMATVNHAFTPSFSLIGTAEARRSMNGPVDALPQREVLIGAGLGLRF